MKKSSFIALVLGTVSGVLFALGMCMALISEWNSFETGIAFGCAGIVSGIITVIIWRRMEHCQPVHISARTLLTAGIAIIGALALGIGMCFSMVWGKMAVGVIIGLAGMLILFALIPFTKGLYD